MGGGFGQKGALGCLLTSQFLVFSPSGLLTFCRLAGEFTMRVWIDRLHCIGSGKCAVNAPTVFQLDDDDKSVAIDPEGKSCDEHSLLAVAKDCPTGAIHLETDDGQRIYP